MISVLLLLVLAWSFYIGYRRGLVLQIYYFVATVISALLAGNFYQSLGKQFDLLIPYASPQEGQGTFFFPSNQLFQLDKVFYAGIGYLLAFAAFYCIGRLIGLFFNLVPTKKFGGKYFRIGAGVLSVGVTLFVLQMILTILATVPLQIVQNSLENSFVAKHMIQSIPVTTDLIKQLWVTKLIG
ncbi:CvpA family protein [Streptococcus infantis]|uniref:CvpA family protein n=1 Tax=Streptococcus infantis TaxID=68892 RepID=UPI0039C16DB5